MYGSSESGECRVTDLTEEAVHQALPPALLIAMLLAAPVVGATPSHAPLLLAQATSSEEQQRQKAAERAAAKTGGKVLAAEPDTVDGKPVYRVKVLTPDGHVRTVVIEAGESAGAR